MSFDVVYSYLKFQALLLEYSLEQQKLREKQKMLKNDWERFVDISEEKLNKDFYDKVQDAEKTD